MKQNQVGMKTRSKKNLNLEVGNSKKKPMETDPQTPSEPSSQSQKPDPEVCDIERS